MAEPTIQVTLCWSLGPQHVHEESCVVPEGSTIKEALDLATAQWLQSKPSPDACMLTALQFQQAGIWGHKAAWTQVVKAGDRIELYRPLKVDPKVARRQRFNRQGKGRTGLFANRKSGSAAGY